MNWSEQWDYFALLHSLCSSPVGDRHIPICLSLVSDHFFVGPHLLLLTFKTKKTLPSWSVFCFNWSGQWDSDPRHQPWQGCALPLSYTRIA